MAKKSEKAIKNKFTSEFNLKQAKENDLKIKKEEALKKELQKAKKVKLIAEKHLSGEFGLPYSKGDVFQIEEKQAKELIDLKAAKKK